MAGLRDRVNAGLAGFRKKTEKNVADSSQFDAEICT
jgi:hypothetical protein